MAVIGGKGNCYFRKRIKEMQPGEVGFIETDAIAFDLHGRPYLDLTERVRAKSNWNYEIPILRTGPSDADYEVDIRAVDYSWNLQEKPFFDERNDTDFWKREIVSLPYREIPGKVKGRTKDLRRRGEKIKVLSADLEYAVRAQEFELASKIRDQLQEARTGNVLGKKSRKVSK